MTDSYDSYADQLLNSAFQNARKTPALNTNHEDQLLNQLFQNARLSVPPTTPSPMYGNNSNDWFLLQQLQQQKELIERQQQMMSPSLFHQVPIQPEPVEETPIKKIARVPVHTEPQELVLEDDIPNQPQVLNNAPTVPPPLNKKKSFLRSLSMKANKHKELTAVAAIATTAIAAKSIQQLYREQQQQEKQRKKEEKEQKREEKERIKAAKLAAMKPKETEAAYESTPKYVDRTPSYWKPRQERPKEWWKGKRANQEPEQEYQEVEYEEEEESEEEEEVPVVVAPPPKKTKKKVVKRVAVPKPVPSIKASKPKRPMAFKQPEPRKPKAEKKKSSKKGAKGSTNITAAATTAAVQPMYMMPQQQMYQPNYYQQPMIMSPQYMPGNYYPQMMGSGAVVPQQPQQETRKSPPVQKSIYNPRDTANDKCLIM